MYLYIYTCYSRNEMWHWTIDKIGVAIESWPKSATWGHGLIAQSVRASERNSVVVGSNPTQANFLLLLQRICVYIYIYIYIIYKYIYIYIYNIQIYIYINIPIYNKFVKKFCFNWGLFRTIISALPVSTSKVLIHFLPMFLIRLNIFWKYLTENHATYYNN